MDPPPPAPRVGEDFRFWGRRHRKREAGGCMPAWPAPNCPGHRSLIPSPSSKRRLGSLATTVPSPDWKIAACAGMADRRQFLPRQGEVAPRSGDGGGGKRHVGWCFLPLRHAFGMPPPPGGGGIGVVCKPPLVLIRAIPPFPHSKAHAPLRPPRLCAKSVSPSRLHGFARATAAKKTRRSSPATPKTRRAERFPRHAGLTRPAGCGTAVAILGGPPPPACLGRTLKS